MPPAKNSKTIWDLPIRLFHWLLMLLVLAAYISAAADRLDIHMAIGKAILALLIFRILWGFVGSESARFRNFLRGPATVLAYARTLFTRTTSHYPGHNPLGGWAVMAMLMALLVQTGTGLFSNDDVLTEAPLFHLVGKETSQTITELHELNFNIVLALIGLHLAAILFYRLWKRQNLVRPMVAGRTEQATPVWRAIACLAAAIAAVYGILQL